MADAALVGALRRKYRSLTPLLNERLRRLWAAAEAREIGWGGVTAVALATGLSQTTIGVGPKELQGPSAEPPATPTALRVREADGDRSGPFPPDRPGGPGRSRDPWRPPVAPALDLQEHPKARRTTRAAGPSDRIPDRGRTPGSSGLQPPVQPQDEGRGVPPGPQRPVRVHQRAGPPVPASGPAGRLGGHQEERTGRRLP